MEDLGPTISSSIVQEVVYNRIWAFTNIIVRTLDLTMFDNLIKTGLNMKIKTEAFYADLIGIYSGDGWKLLCIYQI